MTKTEAGLAVACLVGIVIELGGIVLLLGTIAGLLRRKP